MATALIWDADGTPPPTDGIVLLWRAFADSSDDGQISIPELIESNADALRTRYLNWVHEFGETSIRGKRLLDHLEIRPGFSYWWMTLFAEKCNYSKSPQINDAIRLFAFEKWFDQCRPSKVILISSNSMLADCLRGLCVDSGVVFTWQRIQSIRPSLSWIKKVYQALPSIMQLIVWLLFFIVRRWPLRGVGLSEWKQSAGKITFFSYLFNLVPEAVNLGRFESRYWGHLPDELRKDSVPTNWLHLYIENDSIPNAAEAAHMIRQFNIEGQGKQVHVTLDSFLNLRLIFRAMCEAVSVWRRGQSLIPSAVYSNVTRIDLWPLYRAEWLRTFSGPAVMSNILNLNLFESATSALRSQNAGVYLQENQAWEFALVQAWHTCGHRNLIGFPHSTVRYWDLRYFYSRKSFESGNRNGLPRPEHIAVSGTVVKNSLLEAGYCERSLVMVEALRFFHLHNYGPSDQSAKLRKGPLRVLVMADILEINTERQVRLLEDAARFLPSDTVYIIKPHPAGEFSADKFPRVRALLRTEPLPDLLGDCDVAYSSSITSAALDAYCAGIRVVSMLDPNTLNLSPLRGCEGVVFVSTPKELADALSASASISNMKDKVNMFFTLDIDLLRWRKLLQVQKESVK
ncbi:MAG: hypothetical protein KGO80_03360 [Bacteroidetes bacterium]|nr:hypothetical protein [Bacteroidota bacterium]